MCIIILIITALFYSVLLNIYSIYIIAVFTYN